MKLFLSLFLLFLFPEFLKANQFAYYLSNSDHKAYRIDLYKKEIARLDSNSNWVFYHSLRTDSTYHPDFMKTAVFTVLQKKNTNRIHIFQECTNQIYVVDLTDFQLKRKDDTYYRGVNCLAYRFFRGNEIFSLGGYGFWRTNNHLIYFDKKTKEWEATNAKGQSPPGMYHGFISYIPEKDVIVSFSNYFTDVSDDYGKLKLDQTIYQFSFFTKTWKKLGEITHPVIKQVLEEYSYFDRQHLFYTGKYFVFEPSSNKNGIHKYYFVNPRTLEVFEYNDLELKYARITLGASQSQKPSIFRNGPWLLTVLQNTNPSSTDSFLLINFDDLASDATFIGLLTDLPWYQSDWFYGILLILLASVLIVIMTRIKSKRTKKVVHVSQIQDVKLDIDPTSLRLLKSILENQNEDGLAIDEVNRILDIENLAFDTQRYRRSAMINQVNQTLTLLTGERSSIIRVNSVEDRRQKRYKINPNCLELLQRKLVN
ncbi:hypothetical protein PQG22_04580 [Aquirufa beregesia]